MEQKTVFYAEAFTFDLFFEILFKRKPDMIVLCDSVDFFNNNTNKKNVLERLVTLLFPEINIVREPQYQNNDKELGTEGVCNRANNILLKFTESEVFSSKIRIIISPLIKLVNDENIIIAAKKQFLGDIYQKIIFYLIFQELRRKHKIKKIFIKIPDIFEIDRYIEIEKKINQIEKHNNNLVNIMKKYFYLMCPYFLRLMYRRKIRFLKITKKHYDIGLQIVWGLPPKHPGMNSDTYSNIITDDEIIKNLNTNRKKIIFLNGKKFGRKFSKLDDQNQKKYIEQLGCSFLDDSKLKIPFSILSKNILYFGIYNLFKIREFSKYNSSYIVDKTIQKIYCEYIENKILLAYLDIKIFVSRDDYDSSHVTRTITQNQNQNINVGIQHSAYSYPYVLPLQAYNYFDRYYVQGTKFEELWKPYWNTNKKIIPVGTQRAHLLGIEKLSKQKIDYFKKKYGGKINILLQAGSSSSIHSPKWIYEIKYSRLDEMLRLNDNINLIIKSRFKNDANYLLNLSPNIKNYLDKNLFIEDDIFTTQELISLVDILIVEDNSSTILEAVHLKDLFILGYRIRYPHQKNLNKIVMDNFDDLLDSISFYITEKKFPANYEESRLNIINNFSMDAKVSNWKRIGEDIMNLLS